ncbi:hypothetical protein AMELA_G00015760 [Ameiurus melas]|uniref:Uncharacterized protein n=1 Tax=Ameiurus melas TaxID=219545 RepID=A0A7J6BA70_AMEME|nr:hypothetical protein AMELA_G00015760 [Ameiurus melas]
MINRSRRHFVILWRPRACEKIEAAPCSFLCFSGYLSELYSIPIGGKGPKNYLKSYGQSENYLKSGGQRENYLEDPFLLMASLPV